MFEFLFRSKKPAEKPESQRERFERLILELNEVIDALPHKPAVTIEPETGRISFTMPKQFMDEALALPKPDSAVNETPKTAAPEAPAKDAGSPEIAEPAVKAKKRPGAPVPRPPKPNAPTPKAPA